MPEPSSQLSRTPLKEPEPRARDAEDDPEGEPGGGFESLIPGDGRRSLFKQHKGRLGMG